MTLPSTLSASDMEAEPKTPPENTPVTHAKLFQKLVDHDGKITKMSNDIHGINIKLDPIATGVTSIAWGFKVILWMGGMSAALVAFIELVDHITFLK